LTAISSSFVAISYHLLSPLLRASRGLLFQHEHAWVAGLVTRCPIPITRMLLDIALANHSSTRSGLPISMNWAIAFSLRRVRRALQRAIAS